MPQEYILKPFHSSPALKIDYKAELNEQQLAAVTALPGPALVIAGAGAGKTRTLIYRVAFLLEQGIPADRILLLTFTNKAAREMMQRVTSLLGQGCQELWGGTFHGIGNRILRRHAHELGYQKDFTIMDREDSEHLISACVGELKIDVKATRFPKASVLASIISLMINKQVSLEEVLDYGYEYFFVLEEEIQKVLNLYQKRKKGGNLMDFDDLLVLWLELLKKNQGIREMYQKRFQFILVDEYQDTNKVQGEIIEIMAASHKNIMAVGDDSQSIYSWRGAHFRNILDFPNQFKNASVFKIETNYRSTPEILKLANASIRCNSNQFEKELSASRPSLGKPVLVTCNHASDQAAFVAQRMHEHSEENIPLNEMAVLYRSHFHSLELQMELTRQHIPFTLTSGIRFFEQAHIKDVVAFLKLLCNPRDEIAFNRIVRLWRGIGKITAEKLWNLYLKEIHTTQDTETDLAGALKKIRERIPAKAKTDWDQWVGTMKKLQSPELRTETGKSIAWVLEAFYSDYLEDHFDNARSRLEDLQQVIVFSREFDSPEDFLSQLALLTNMDTEDATEEKEESDKVKLSTIHQAKGLEYRVVFVIMLCDGLFPSEKSMQSEEGEEEERRLFYVAVTRAKDHLYLLYPLVRGGYGGGGDLFQQPSRFLSELPEWTRDEWKIRRPGGYEPW